MSQEMDMTDAKPTTHAGEAKVDKKGTSGTGAGGDADKPDARLSSAMVGGGGSTSATLPGSTLTMGTIPAHDFEFEYNMQHKRRGVALIINNRNFEKRTGMNDRSGTDADAANLYQKFKLLDFDVRLKQNQTVAQMRRIMFDLSREDHNDADCFVCAVLSHGDEGVIYGVDDIMPVDELVMPVKGMNCESLIGKPKIFFIQACRGNELDHGVEVADGEEDEDEIDALPRKRRIPQEADVLLCFSTVPGYFSWRNSTKGSWFVQALCAVLEKYGDSQELMWMMTRVNFKVAYEFQSNAAKEYMNKKKQVPSIVSMLTKDVYFRPKHA